MRYEMPLGQKFDRCSAANLHNNLLCDHTQNLSTTLVILAAASLSNLSGDVVGVEALVTDQVGKRGNRSRGS